MFVPFFSVRLRDSDISDTERRLARRRGGGKTGGSTSSSGGKSSSSSSSSSSGKSGSSSSSSGTTGKSGSSSSGSRSGSSSSSSSTRKVPISSGGTSRSSSGSSKGGGRPSVIPSGQLFAGRSQGGGTRTQIWGTRAYGSGYPGTFSRGVFNRGFPFYFWPIAWGAAGGYGADALYMHVTEYGEPNNSSRPGGPEASATFQSNSTGTTFRLVSDNSTVANLMSDIATNCSSYLTPASANATAPIAFNETLQKPEQVVQYYRASSVALSLDGYNNSAVFAPENSTADTPLPSGIDTNLLDCLNYTIGLGVPLVDAGVPTLARPSFALLLVFLLVQMLF